MTRKFGTAYTQLSEEERGLSSHFFHQFETAKKNFTGPTHTRRLDVWPINMNTPKSAQYDKRNFTVKLQRRVHYLLATHTLTSSSTDMIEMFDPPINEVIELVESQVAAASRKGDKIHVSSCI